MENPPNSWSELPLDLLNSVFERLGFADFQRGKSVCSSWHSASRQSVPKNQIPWVIFFPQDKSNNSCTLFNPEEKDKLYQIQDLGADFGKSVCKATYGSWLLMRDPLYNLYIVNVFTKEKINLPPVESQLGTTKIERTLEDHMFLISNDKKKHMSRGISISAPVFWIDDKTKDCVVIWELGRWCLLYSKRGDDFWNQIPEPTNYFDLVYKDHKLYFSCHQGTFGIYDFSGEIPQQTFFGNLNRDFPPDRSKTVIIYTKLVVTLTGDVLRVVRRLCRWRRTSYFYVYKVYSSGSLMYERVHSLGNEAMLFDLGITVLANDTTGLKKNSIYFNIGPYSYVHDATEMFLFNLQTRKMEPQHEFDSSSFQLKTARWFLPSFIRKCLV